MTELGFREGGGADLRTAFLLGESAWDASRRERGLLRPGEGRDDGALEDDWQRTRPFAEFVAAQDGGAFWICDDGDEMVGYARSSRFGSMDEMTELWVSPNHSGHGIGRSLLGRIWPDRPTPDLGRVVVTLGTPVDLTLYTEFGVMPAAGHWHMRQRVDRYLELRAQEVDATLPAVHALTPERAVVEWKRLEPPAIGHERPLLHEFFGRTRSCLALLDEGSGGVLALCWVSSEGDIGPAVGGSPQDLIPLVLSALDRVAKMHEPESFGVFCTSSSWWLLDRLRRLGFWIHWPAWVLSSVPLPGLDRYLPTRPARLL